MPAQQLVSIMLSVAAPLASVNVSPFGERLLGIGSRDQMVPAAAAAVKCGFDVVTIRPWQQSDTPGFKPPGKHPMSLITETLSRADVGAMIECYDQKMHIDESIIQV